MKKMKIQSVSIISKLGMTFDHIFNVKRNNSERCNDISSISNFTLVVVNKKMFLYRLWIIEYWKSVRKYIRGNSILSSEKSFDQ
jgi:hypothetical protein